MDKEMGDLLGRIKGLEVKIGKLQAERFELVKLFEDMGESKSQKKAEKGRKSGNRG